MQVDIKVHELLVEVINKLCYPAIQIIVVTIRDEDVVLEGGDYGRHTIKLNIVASCWFLMVSAVSTFAQ